MKYFKQCLGLALSIIAVSCSNNVPTSAENSGSSEVETYAAKKGSTVAKYEMIFNNKSMQVFFLDNADGSTELFEDNNSRLVKKILSDYPRLNMMYDPLNSNIIWLSATPEENDSLRKVLWEKYGISRAQGRAKVVTNPYGWAAGSAYENIFAGKYLQFQGEGRLPNLSITWVYDVYNVGKTISNAMVGGFWNDVISSIFVNYGCWVTIYQHSNYGGYSKTFTGERGYDLTQEHMAVFWLWNDKASSVKWGGN